MELGLLALAALLAGFIDAVAGGGGLVQVPALLGAMPAESPATVFGTNKGASVWGTGSAALRYARRIAIPWQIVAPATISALVFSFVGAATVSWLPRTVLQPLVLVLLVAVTLYTAFKPTLGMEVNSVDVAHERPKAMLVGAVLGFYDGFFGPGMGSFLIFCFVRFFGLDFLRASAAAKVVNVATNATALLFFAAHGQVLWGVAAVMALFNIAGAWAGSHIALKRGSGFVRGVFLVVASVLIVRFGYNIWFS